MKYCKVQLLGGLEKCSFTKLSCKNRVTEKHGNTLTLLEAEQGQSSGSDPGFTALVAVFH